MEGFEEWVRVKSRWTNSGELKGALISIDECFGITNNVLLEETTNNSMRANDKKWTATDGY